MTAYIRTRGALFGALVLAAAATSSAHADGSLPGVGSSLADPTVGVVEVSTNPTENASGAAERPIGLFAYLRNKFDDKDPAELDVETTGSIAPAVGAKSLGAAAPAGIRDLVRKHALAAGVPPELAEAVVHVESSFNPRARGRAGEIGLMQIKPATARGIGYKGSANGLYDPETNLTWGMLYLAKAYQLAGGDTCGAILRYNAGHAAKRMSKGVRAYCSKVDRYVASL